ncbi:MAG: hypothetical protein QM523_04220 [Candidatus Pacebacteria bacterium]|nr:hypothetical protein [Candidatus Paceibacterota bacterium]
METRHSYNPKLLVRSLFLAITGIVISLIMLFFFKPIMAMALIWMVIIVVCFGAAFALWERQKVVAVVTEESITVKSFKTVTMDWNRVTGLKLSFFAKRRDQKDGWMRLRIKSGPVVIKIDSQIHNFARILNLASRTIAENGYEVDYFTRVNLHAVGIDYEKP